MSNTLRTPVVEFAACADCPLADKSTGMNNFPFDGMAMPIRHCRVFPMGERIFEEGTPIAGVHCVCAGKVALIRQMKRQEWIVAVVNPGDILGMPDALTGDHYQNGAMVLEETSVCFIPRDGALEILQKNPAAMVQILQKICARISSAEQRVGE